MITATASSGPAPLVFQATVNGLPIYLDNHAIIDLARGPAGRQDRFIGVLEAGADLMFSVTNAVELAGPQGTTTTRVREFLDRVGPRWFPVTIGTEKILALEAAGQGSMNHCVSRQLVTAFFENRMSDIEEGADRLIVLDDAFFCPSCFIDWLAPHRADLREDSENLDLVLMENIRKARALCDSDPGLLDRAFPALPFDSRKPTTFVQGNLVRALISESKSFHLKKGDGCDFHHVIMGATFASFAIFDKHWVRRVRNFPQPNRIARVYSPSELDQFVTDLELAVATLAAQR